MHIKRQLPLLLCLLALLASCGKSDDSPSIDVNVLTSGKWLQQNGTGIKPSDRYYWRYAAGGTGVTWNESTDTNDYVGEFESNLVFSWRLDGNELTHVFRGEMGNQGVTRFYTITAMNSSTMVWEDYYGDQITLVKQ